MSVSQGKLSSGNRSVLLKKRPREGATVGTYSTATSGNSSYHCSEFYQGLPTPHWYDTWVLILMLNFTFRFQRFCWKQAVVLFQVICWRLSFQRWGNGAFGLLFHLYKVQLFHKHSHNGDSSKAGLSLCSGKMTKAGKRRYKGKGERLHHSKLTPTGAVLQQIRLQ